MELLHAASSVHLRRGMVANSFLRGAGKPLRAPATPSCRRRPRSALPPVKAELADNNGMVSSRRKVLEGMAGGFSLALMDQSLFPLQALAESKYETALFAGGCFWCMEPPFDKLDGVISTTSGYSGGKEPNPTYKVVSSGATKHAEAIQIEYDPSKVTYEELLDVFWHNINPTQTNAQFCDQGYQYRSAIFYKTPAEKAAAEATKKKYGESGVFRNGNRELVTEVTPAGKFWPAEEYHQDFYIKNPDTYYFYRGRCGRDRYLNAIWGTSADTKKANENEVMG